MFIEPVVLEHAAAFLGKSPWIVSRDSELLAQAHLVAYDRYHHAHIVAGIDVYTVEPEAYGAVLADPGNNGVPVVETCPLSSVESLTKLTVGSPDTFGRFPILVQAAEHIKTALHAVDVQIPISGPFTLASHLIGLESLVMDAAMNPEAVRDAVMHLSIQQRLLAEFAGTKGFACTVYESAAMPPFLSPAMFREIAGPALKNLLDACGPEPALIAGGKAHLVASDLAELGAGYVICPHEADGQAFMDVLQSCHDITVRVNMDPSVFEGDDEQALEAELQRAASIASIKAASVIGTGVLSYGARPEMVERAREMLKAEG